MLQSLFPVLLGVHLFICLVLIGAILMQRSEGGGALGIGGGGPGNMMSGRSASNLMVRATQILGALFFATSLGLTLIAAQTTRGPGSVMDRDTGAAGSPLSAPEIAGSPAPASAPTQAPATGAAGGGIPASAPTAPTGIAPITAAPAAPAQPAPAPAPDPAPAPAEPAKAP